jgi:uncharacterized protein (TIGR03437 family)
MMKSAGRGSRLGASMRCPAAALAVLLLGASAPYAQTIPGSISVVSGASYAAGRLAPDSVGSIFGDDLAREVIAAPTAALPTQIASVSVQIVDSAGAARPAGLYFVSPQQVNFLVPSLTKTGTATVILTAWNGKLYQASVQIRPTAPGLFTANANGQGVAAATYDRYGIDGFIASRLVATWDTPTQLWYATPVVLGPASEQTFLTLYGTGIRHRSTSPSSVAVQVGGVNCTVTYAGDQTVYPGLDQVNVLLPLSLNGKGTVTVQLTVDGQDANPASIIAGTTPAAPSLSSLSPTSALLGATVALFAINGSNLSGAVAAISPDTGLVLSSVTVTPTRVTAQLAITPAALAGAHTVTVLTDGGVSNSLNFIVIPAPIPALSYASPQKVNAGQTTAVAIAGNNLSGVTAIQFAPPDGIAVSALVATANSVSARIAVAASAAYGPRQVAVVSTGGVSNQIPLTILVQDPSFVISNLVAGPGTNSSYATVPISVTFQDPSGAVSSGQPVIMDVTTGNPTGAAGFASFTPAGLSPGQTTGTVKDAYVIIGSYWVMGFTMSIAVNLEAPPGRTSNVLTGTFVAR